MHHFGYASWLTHSWIFAPSWSCSCKTCSSTKLQLSLIILYPIIPLEQASWVQTLFKRISTLLASLNGFMIPWDLVWHLRNLIFLQQLLSFGISWWLKECPPRTRLQSMVARNSKKDLWHTRQMYLVPQTSRMFQVHITMKILSQITYASCLLVNPWKYDQRLILSTVKQEKSFDLYWGNLMMLSIVFSQHLVERQRSLIYTIRRILQNWMVKSEWKKTSMEKMPAFDQSCKSKFSWRFLWGF